LKNKSANSTKILSEPHHQQLHKRPDVISTTFSNNNVDLQLCDKAVPDIMQCSAGTRTHNTKIQTVSQAVF